MAKNKGYILMRSILFVFLLFSLIINAQKSDFSHINFEKAVSIARSNSKLTLKNIPLLAYKLTNELDTQVEKFRAIHTWVCSNIKSDHDFGDKTLRKRRKLKNDSTAFLIWNNKVQAKVFKTLLEEQKTICTGYAYLIKELSSLSGINCKIVDGYSRTLSNNVGEIDIPNHSWNTVELNGKWYLVDATLSSGFFDLNLNIFINDYNDGYFLASPELYIKKYYPLNEKWTLLENVPTLTDFVEAPMVYGNTFEHNILPIAPNDLVTRISTNEDVIFKLKISDKNKLDHISFVLSSGLRYEKIKLSHLNYNNGFVEVKHCFAKKGNYDVHIKVEEDIVASYNVKVEKS